MDPIDLPPPKSIDLRTSSYFSTSWKLAGIVFVLAGLLIVFVNIFIGVALLIVGILIVTTHYRISVDFNNHTYHDYVWVLGIKNGQKGKFDRIEYVFITRSKVSQTLASRATQSTFVRDEFNGYLKFSEDLKIHLRSDESKKDLTNAMQHFAMKFGCELVDYSIR